MEPPARPVKAIRLEDHHADGSHRVIIRSDKGDVVLTHKKPWQVNVKNNNHSATASFAVFIAEENFKSSDAFWRDACPDFFHDVNHMGQFLALDFIALCIARGESDRLGGHEFELEWMTFKNVATSKLLGFPSTGSGFHGWTRSDTEKAFRIAANIQGPDSDEGDSHYKPQLDVKGQDEESNETKAVDTKVNIKRKVDAIDEEDPEEKVRLHVKPLYLLRYFYRTLLSRWLAAQFTFQTTSLLRVVIWMNSRKVLIGNKFLIEESF